MVLLAICQDTVSLSDMRYAVMRCIMLDVGCRSIGLELIHTTCPAKHGVEEENIALVSYYLPC
jgi:hypothetical protein